MGVQPIQSHNLRQVYKMLLFYRHSRGGRPHVFIGM